MRRTVLIAFALSVGAGLLALLVVSGSDERRLAFTLGVFPGGVAADLPPGGLACQERVLVSEPFSEITLQVGTYGRRGGPLTLLVRSDDGATLARGAVPGGYSDVSTPEVHVGRVAAGQSVSVCLRNRGPRRLGLYGGPEQAAPRSEATLDGAPTETDLTLVFLRERPRSALALVPDIFEHAARFKPGWVGEWTYWLLAVLVLAGVPLLLGGAIAGVREPPGGPESSDGRVTPGAPAREEREGARAP